MGRDPHSKLNKQAPRFINLRRIVKATIYCFNVHALLLCLLGILSVIVSEYLQLSYNMQARFWKSRGKALKPCSLRLSAALSCSCFSSKQLLYLLQQSVVMSTDRSQQL
jgi:hypothetical protein